MKQNYIFKRTLSALLLLLASSLSWAYDFEAKNADGVTIYYNLINDGTEAEVTYSIDSSTASYFDEVISIPETVIYNGKTLSVTSIGEWAFYNCSGLTSVTIPEGVTSIGDGAFTGCSSLTSIVIPESATSIGRGIFCFCEALKSVNIPEGVTSIGLAFFKECRSLTSITIPNSVTEIGVSAFLHCSSLTSVTIGNSVTYIGPSAFSSCSSLTSITIPNSVTSIDNFAFSNCRSLTSVYSLIENPFNLSSWGVFQSIADDATLYVPQGTKSAYESVGWTIYFSNVVEFDTTGNADFEAKNADGVTIYYNLINDGTEAEVTYSIDPSTASYFDEVNIPETTIYNGKTLSVTSIGNHAFSACSGLTSITIPNSVTSIGSSAFSACSGLTSITIPNSVTSIGSSAFSACSGLTSVTIPESVTSIGNHAFSACNGLTSITISESVTSIGNYAFQNCRSLTSVTIPGSVTSIGDYAFYDCSGLTSVTIPGSVTSIGGWAFYECSGLTSVTILEGVTSIGYYAFQYCSSLTSITIPNSMTSIGQQAFGDCSSLTSVYSLIENPFSTLYYAFSGIADDATLYVPQGTKSAYESAGGWTDYFSNVVEFNPMGIADFEAKNADGVTIYYNLINDGTEAEVTYSIDPSIASYFDEVNIPETTIYNGKTLSVTSIGESAFRECRSLTSVTIPNSVTSIGSSAFYGCSGLTSITIPNSVTSIGDHAFSSCRSLTSVTIPNSVTSIGNYAFYNCSGLTSVTIPNSVTSIGDWAFYNCSGLTSVTISNSVTSIGESAFAYCSGLTSVYSLIENPFSIPSKVFNGIARGATLYVPQGTKSAYESTEGWTRYFSNVVEFNATGITDTPAERANGDVIYNLNGVRVDRPTNGLYIKNGKKVMVK